MSKSPEIYVPDERYYALLDRLNPYKETDSHYDDERQRILEALAEAGIWPAYTRDEADAPRYQLENYQPA